MSIVDRARNILLAPRTEWPRIAAEPATPGGLFTGYAMILALLPVIGGLLGALLFHRVYGIGLAIVPIILSYAIGLAILYVMGLIAEALAPSFDGRRGQVGGMKLVVYAATATWIAGFFSFIPGLNVIVSLVGFAWAAYLLYLGCQSVLGVPEAKAVGYTIVLVLIWIVLSFVVAGLIVGLVVASMVGGLAMGSAAGGF